MDKGTRVTFRVGPLGMTNDEAGQQLADRMVQAGDEGEYLYPIEQRTFCGEQYENWHLIKVGDNFCPVHVSMFEPVDS